MEERDVWMAAIALAWVLSRLGVLAHVGPPRYWMHGPADARGPCMVKEAFSVMDPGEARRVKRRYRKLWRKGLVAQYKENEGYGCYISSPSRRKAHKSYREPSDGLDAARLLAEWVGLGSRGTKGQRAARWQVVRGLAWASRVGLDARASLGLARRYWPDG